MYSQQKDSHHDSGRINYFVINRINLAILLLFIVLSSSAQNNVLEKSLSISFTDISLKKALDKLEEEAGISFPTNVKR